jgi:hypothetical protein
MFFFSTIPSPVMMMQVDQTLHKVVGNEHLDGEVLELLNKAQVCP